MTHIGLPLSEDSSPGRRHQSRHDRRRHERRRRRGGYVAVLVALLLFGGIAAGLFFGGKALLERIVPAEAEDYPGPGSGDATVVIQPGDSVRMIADRLVEADVIASRQAFLDAAENEARATSIQPGTYQLVLKMASADALIALLDPAARVVEEVGLPEGWTLKQSLARIAEKTGIPLTELEDAAADGAAIGLPAYAQGRADGYVFPATYQFEPNLTGVEVLKATVTRFAEAAAKVRLEERAAAVGLTPAEVVTVASLVEAEAQRPEDYGKVSRVIHNRLAQGMPLQLDSTVNYVTGKTGITTTAEDRATPSPYNTYRQAGLPPGPVSSPGEAALEAALAPTPGPWLYFVAVNPDTGETKYATTLAEHNKNVAEFQAWLRNR